MGTLVETLEKGTQCISTFVEKEVKIMERTTLLIVVLVAALSMVEARKFCPKERNGDKCKAKKASYKCGVFFKDLSPKVPLAWLGALPEAVVRARKEGATDNDVIELLGSNVDGPSYDNFECGDVGANTRCYAQMQKVRDEDYDSGGKSLVRKKWSDQADETMGDYLCGQVHRWLKRNSDYKQNGMLLVINVPLLHTAFIPLKSDNVLSRILILCFRK